MVARRGGPNGKSINRDLDVALYLHGILMNPTPRLKRFGNPYGLIDSLDWIKCNLIRPSWRYQYETAFIDQKTCLNQIDSKLTVVFVGDLMPTGNHEFRFGQQFREFVEGADYLSINLEGVIGDCRRVWNAQRHSASVMDLMESLFPAAQTIVSCANNHAADCGRAAFEVHCHLLEARGFAVIGSRERPSVRLNGDVQISGCTFWSNQSADYLAQPEDMDRESESKAAFKILQPHWGYEMHLYPSPRQIKLGKQFLRSWNAVVGHHSHCPQPIAQQENQLIAYSLGDLLFGNSRENWHHGLVVKIGIGPNETGLWQVGEVDWRFTRQTMIQSNHYEVETVRTCTRFFPDLTS